MRGDPACTLLMVSISKVLSSLRPVAFSGSRTAQCTAAANVNTRSSMRMKRRYMTASRPTFSRTNDSCARRLGPTQSHIPDPSFGGGLRVLRGTAAARAHTCPDICARQARTCTLSRHTPSGSARGTQ